VARGAAEAQCCGCKKKKLWMYKTKKKEITAISIEITASTALRFCSTACHFWHLSPAVATRNHYSFQKFGGFPILLALENRLVRCTNDFTMLFFNFFWCATFVHPPAVTAANALRILT